MYFQDKFGNFGRFVTLLPRNSERGGRSFDFPPGDGKEEVHGDFFCCEGYWSKTLFMIPPGGGVWGVEAFRGTSHVTLRATAVSELLL